VVPKVPHPLRSPECVEGRSKGWGMTSRKDSIRQNGIAFAPRQLPSLRRRLLRWYDENRRDLPWRRRPDDAYAQLLAEFMLQQTQVSTVLGYYERFIQRFPTVKALANAPLDDVLTLWSGLGYYSRARNLHAAARKIVEQHSGIVPATVEELMKLPGIGRYTAGAIASIAYGVRAPVLDGNVIRVLMRLLAMKADPRSTAARERLWDEAERLLPQKRCGDFNQALMELGATLCSPRTPNCKACPLHRRCQAYLHGLTDHIPPVRARTRVVPQQMVVAAVRRKDELLFVQRPERGLWARLWELPSEPVTDGESPDTARKRLEANLPVRCRLSESAAGTVTRQLTHRRITFEVFTGTTRNHGRQTPPYPRPWRWMKPQDVRNVGISRACKAIVALLGHGDSSESQHRLREINRQTKPVHRPRRASRS
jgi:A/G-specific adenine glycosylase